MTTTPKNTNGTATLKSANDQSAAKSTKSKPKKVAAKVKETVEPVAPKEPELSAEEKRVKKEVCKSGDVVQDYSDFFEERDPLSATQAPEGSSDSGSRAKRRGDEADVGVR